MSYIKNYFAIFLSALVILLITKLIFSYYIFNNITLEKEIYAILWGYKFDFASAAIIAFLATFFDFNKKLLISISLLLLTILYLSQSSDLMYYYEAQRHVSYEIKDILKDSSALIKTAFTVHSTLLIFLLCLFLILFYFLNKFLNFSLNVVKIDKKYYIFKKLIIILISVFFVRGMVQHIPLNPWQSNQIGNSAQASIALNGTYSMLYSLIRSKKGIKQIELPIKEVDKKRVASLYKGGEKAFSSNLNNPNIIFLFLESWSGTFIKSYGYDRSTTPYFDELLKKSIRPKAMLAGGHRTTEGIFTTLTSFQNPLGKSVSKNQLQNYEYETLIDILKKEASYSSAFFQGTSKETGGAGSLTQSLGFEKSYGKRDIKKRIYEENSWGVHDPDLYNFTLKKAKEMKEPFILGINGATTHDLHIPKNIEIKNLVSQDKELNMRLNTFNFADKSLKEFIERTEKMYPNTIFVLLADHCGSGIKHSNFLNYMIPFAIYSKNLDSKYIDSFISQRDIAPTILDLILGNYKKYAPFYTGKSIIREENFFADYFHNGILGIVKDNLSVEINTFTNKTKCYKLENFKDINIECPEISKKYKDEILNFSQYSQDLIFKGKTKLFIKN